MSIFPLAKPATPFAQDGNSNRTTARGLRSQRGQSLVEVALLTPFLLAMVLGAIEIGRYAYISMLVGNAAHAGALYGSQSISDALDSSGIQKAADNDFQNNGQLISALTVTSNMTCGCDNGGILTSEFCTDPPNPTAGSCPLSGNWVIMISVTASGTFKSLFKYPWIPGSISVSRISTMRVKND